MNRLQRIAVSLVVVPLGLLLAVTPAVAQSQTPGQITQFDPNLNVVDSVITQDPSGNIGIGTTTPAAALDVATGDLNIAGNLFKGGTLFMHIGQPTMFGGTENTFLGINAGATASGAGGANTAFGFRALQNINGGNWNSAFGDRALWSNENALANTAIGYFALYNNSGLIANNNTAIGYLALYRNASGMANTAIGGYADVSQGDLVNATAIGAFAIVDASNKVRLGNTQVEVIEGQVPYTFTSDKNQKENFQTVDGDEVLRKLGNVNITSWNYIGHDPQQFRHYGAVAQEFFAAFGHDGVGAIGTPTTINSGDLEGILMIAVQALDRQNRELKTRVVALERLVNGKTAGVQ